MKIGIVGAGAIGLTFAAMLARTHEVTVLARRAAVAEIVQRDGIEVVGDAFVPVDAPDDVRAQVAGGTRASGGNDRVRYVRVPARASTRAHSPIATPSSSR
ncbi:MAG: 2-dehydropantoate 2-reductase N-terminal domain-containing protein [Candidatus Elarobacter sp.]